MSKSSSLTDRSQDINVNDEAVKDFGDEANDDEERMGKRYGVGVFFLNMRLNIPSFFLASFA